MMDQDLSWQGKGQGRLPANEDYSKTWELGVSRQSVFQMGIGMCHVLEVKDGRKSDSLWPWYGGMVRGSLGKKGRRWVTKGLSALFLCCSISLEQVGEWGGNTPSLTLMARHPHGLTL